MGSSTLDEFLGKQKMDKHEQGYVGGPSSSISKGKSVFVKGSTMNEDTPIVPTVSHVKSIASASKRNVPQSRFPLVCHHCGVKGHIGPHCRMLRANPIPICHYCGIRGHIRPHCHRLKRHLFEHQRMIPCSSSQDKIKLIWIRRSDLRCNVVLSALKAQN